MLTLFQLSFGLLTKSLKFESNKSHNTSFLDKLKQRDGLMRLFNPFISSLYNNEMIGIHLPIEICQLIVSYIPQSSIYETNLKMIESSYMNDAKVFPLSYYMGYVQMFIFCLLITYQSCFDDYHSYEMIKTIIFMLTGILNKLIVIHIFMMGLCAILCLVVILTLREKYFNKDRHMHSHRLTVYETPDAKSLCDQIERCLTLLTFRIANMHNHYGINICRKSKYKHNYSNYFYSYYHHCHDIWFKTLLLLLVWFFDVSNINSIDLGHMCISICVFLAIHFILMNGIDKIASNCWTWLNLLIDNYHTHGWQSFSDSLSLSTLGSSYSDINILKLSETSKKWIITLNTFSWEQIPMSTYCYKNLVPFSCFDAVIPCLLFCIFMILIHQPVRYFLSFVVNLIKIDMLVDVLLILCLFVLTLMILHVSIQFYIFLFDFEHSSNTKILTGSKTATDKFCVVSETINFHFLLNACRKKNEFTFGDREFIHCTKQTVESWYNILKQFKKNEQLKQIARNIKLTDLLNENEMILLQIWLYDTYYCFIYQLTLEKLIQFLILFSKHHSKKQKIVAIHKNTLKQILREKEQKREVNKRENRRISRQQRRSDRQLWNKANTYSRSASLLNKSKNFNKHNWKLQNKATRYAKRQTNRKF